MLITTGATEAIASAVLALCGPGDEVVTFQPYYDSYAATIALSGATLRAVPLRPPTFAFDPDELRAAFSPRTRVVLVNTPHNPTGTVLGREQLTYIGQLAAEFDAVVVTDEVYEHMTYDGIEHVPMATLPGLAERTLTISSAGKTFSVTGWKVGWVHGPIALVNAVRAVKQFLTYVSGAPFQPALATALGLPDSFYADLAGTLARKRDLLVAGSAHRRVHRLPDARHVLRRDGRGPAGVRRRRGLLLAPAGADRGRGRAGVGVLRRPGPGADAGALRVLQARRGADRGRVAARVAADPDLRT